mmetsp:Transcript_13475/g.34581  ORF Transcript_13475/g.34581 Transcript_13475/m.34581 type:complete len:97 (-) Transcript_13475:68-358(-)
MSASSRSSWNIFFPEAVEGGSARAEQRPERRAARMLGGQVMRVTLAGRTRLVQLAAATLPPATTAAECTAAIVYNPQGLGTDAGVVVVLQQRLQET